VRARATIACFSALLSGACEDLRVQRPSMADADPGRGRLLVERVGCGACHVIPGVSWPRGRVGPSLDGFARQALVAGRFPNTAEVLPLWVRNAPSLSPGTAMPPMPLSEQDARDVAAYLFTLEPR